MDLFACFIIFQMCLNPNYGLEIFKQEHSFLQGGIENTLIFMSHESQNCH